MRDLLGNGLLNRIKGENEGIIKQRGYYIQRSK